MNRPYTPFDIIWIKNVTNSEFGKAYMDLKTDEFNLHFPTKHKGNVLSPKIGELILIHQKINGRRVFTHLVAPVDDILIEESSATYKYSRRVKIVAKTNIKNVISISSTLWNKVSFRGISQGNVCAISNISNIETYDILLQDIWKRFTPFFRTGFKNAIRFTKEIEDEIDNSDTQILVSEGKLRLVTHFARERVWAIVKRKKEIAIQNDLLFCEVCSFSFIDTFGIDFIECHHKTPLSESGITVTTLDDLVLVCANCHRMLHKKFDGNFLTIKELKQRFFTMN